MAEQRRRFSLQAKPGHEFQNDRAHDVPLSAAAVAERNIGRQAVRNYREAAGGTTGADGQPDMAALLYAMQGKAKFVQQIYAYTTAPQLILPEANRTYFFIQNLDAAANLLVGFGVVPEGVAGKGVKIIAGGFYEPFRVPQNDIYIAGSAGGFAVVLFAIG